MFLFSPGFIFIQETKSTRQNKFVINDYQSFELVRQSGNGGGLLTAVRKELDPVEISRNEDHEILVVEASLSNRRIRLINGYGPQETQPESVRKSFYANLDLEIKKAKVAGKLICVEMDSNAKLGPGFIPLDPREQSDNGRLLQNVIIENELILVNATDICRGSITRYRKTINSVEESILDHFLVCADMFTLISSMVVDEEGKFTLTKYTNKIGSRAQVKPSDHRTLFLHLNLSLNKINT